MVKNISKRTFALLLSLVLLLGAFAAFFGTNAYAAAYDDIINGLTSAEEKPEVKKVGTPGSAAAIGDFDNCLTDAQETQLLNILHETAQKVKCNVGIVITKDLEGKTDARYSDIWSDEVFGRDTSSIVLMFLDTYDRPEYSRYEDQISTFGKMNNRFSQRIIQRTFDRIYDKMGNPRGSKYAYNETTKTYGGYNYYDACVEFANCVKRYGKGGISAVMVKLGDYAGGNFMMFAGGIVLAAVITLIVVSAKVSGYKRKAALSAVNYMDRRATRVTHQEDRFIREYTTSHTNSSSGGGHGGGGGGGGHSGGHGGGGGHHR